MSLRVITAIKFPTSQTFRIIIIFFCIRQGKLRLSRNILMQVYSGHSFKVQRAISSQEAVGGAGPGGGRPATAP